MKQKNKNTKFKDRYVLGVGFPVTFVETWAGFSGLFLHGKDIRLLKDLRSESSKYRLVLERVK